ncbi:hypothetical protein C4J97_2485 [Pseudomonas orientalis]|nr:hypothetical protein C4J97_2485 [Pseudomonas orientalis]
MSTDAEVRPPLPPFTRESAIEKVRLAEDGWNSRDPHRVSLAYTLDTQWRNRAEFVHNREEAKGFPRCQGSCRVPRFLKSIPGAARVWSCLSIQKNVKLRC